MSFQDKRLNTPDAICTPLSVVGSRYPRNGGHRAARGPWLRLIADVLKLAGSRAELVRHTEKNWSSATFTGTAHSLVITFTGTDSISDGEAYIAALPEHEFTIPGQLVADAVIKSVEHTLLPTPHLRIEAELVLIEDV